MVALGILALSFLIIVHELGHFTVAKLSGIKVLEFSLFMGPKLFSFQKGETTYSLRLVPLGGYVRMEGEEEASDDARAFNKQPVYKRAAVIVAGPFMNLFAAFIIIAVMFSVSGYKTTVAVEPIKGTAAYDAGIHAGDRILTFNAHKVYHPLDVSMFSFTSKGNPVDVKLQRGNQTIDTKIVPQKVEPQYIIGIIHQVSGDKVTNVIDDVVKDGPADKAGLKKGDVIVKMNGQTVENRDQIKNFLQVNKTKTVKFTVLRNGVTKDFDVTPKLDDTTGEYYDTGLDFRYEKSSNIIRVLKNSLAYTYSVARGSIYSLVWLVTGKVGLSQVSGPVGIVITIGDVVKAPPVLMDKILGFLSITAFISINLGAFNLIPFPALDGSKLVILAIEGIRKKALPPEKEAMITMVGFVLLIMLMIFTTSNDIIRWFTNSFGGG